MSTPDKRDYPAYAAHLARNAHRKAERDEIDKTLDQASRGFNKSLYGLDYYLKKELKRQKVKL